MKRIFLVMLVMLGCCGPSARDKALRVSYVTLTGAAEGFAEWDLQHQQSILDSSSDQPTFQQKIDAYRLKRTAVVQALTSAYKLLATALIEPSKVNVFQVAEAVTAVMAAIDELKGGKP